MDEFKDNIKKDSSLPLVSILIPLYNAEQYIGGLLDWCLRQPYKNIEVVVVDDHSTDKSYSIAKKYESDRVHVLTNPKKGAQSARNFAFENSKGRFVKFHDADDYSSDNIIVRQVERMLKDGDEDTIVFSSRHTIDEYGNYGGKATFADKDFDDPIDHLVFTMKYFIHYNPHCYLFTRQTVEKAGGWDESVVIAQDTYFITNAIVKSSKLLFVAGEYGVWRIFDDNKHLHKRTPEKMVQLTDVIFKVVEIVLNHRDDEYSRESISFYIGRFVYGDIKSFAPLLPYIDSRCKKLGITWTKIKSPRLGILYSTLGWKRTTLIIQYLKKLSQKFLHRKG